jgi:hypothetical protein
MKEKQLKLYVWHNVLCDYTCGVMFAMAYSVEQARELIVESGINVIDGELNQEPTVYDAPAGFAVWGGAQMTPKQSEALYVVLGYLDAYECSLCGGSEPGQHTEGCPVLELRVMVTTPQTLYDWSNVPDEIMWIATDSEKEGGEVFAYETMPYISRFYMHWTSNDNGYRIHITPNYPVEWQNSLERRPTNL